MSTSFNRVFVAMIISLTMAVGCDDDEASLRSVPGDDGRDGGGGGERLVVSFTDPVGDQTGPIDVIEVQMIFDNSTGNYEVLLTADDANPFFGDFRINLNFFNPDTPGGTAPNPSFFVDTLNDFSLNDATTVIALFGTDPRLLSWEAGDRVATSSFPFGNPDGVTLFRSAVASFPFTFGTNEDTIAAVVDQGGIIAGDFAVITTMGDG